MDTITCTRCGASFHTWGRSLGIRRLPAACSTSSLLPGQRPGFSGIRDAPRPTSGAVAVIGRGSFWDVASSVRNSNTTSSAGLLAWASELCDHGSYRKHRWHRSCAFQIHTLDDAPPSANGYEGGFLGRHPQRLKCSVVAYGIRGSSWLVGCGRIQGILDRAAVRIASVNWASSCCNLDAG